jgi:hypothetical protein
VEDGGVPIVSISETDCWGVLEGKDCPGCIVPDCLILATVEGYRVGRKLENLPSVATDAANGIARIDNKTWRTPLPSTQSIAQALLCLRNLGGVPGPKGDPGNNGSNGLPGGQGPAGDPGLDWTLAHICAISWRHKEGLSISELKEPGLRIGFDIPVILADVDDRSLEVQLEVKNDDGTVCWCNWPSAPRKGIVGLKFETPCEKIESATETPAGPNGEVAGVWWRPGSFPRPVQEKARIRVLLHGDLIADVKGRSVDGNHLAPWLKSGTNTKSGDGIRGGTFESWFILEP